MSVPVLWSDWRLAVSRVTTRVPDARVSHFWDVDGTLVKKAYSRILRLSDRRPAWDVYLVFDRDAEWKDVPPAPQGWMHQLPRAPAERLIRARGPWRHVEAVEFAALAWVDWFNTRRLLAPIGYVRPVEYEDAYYREQQRQRTPAIGAGVNQPSLRRTRRGSR